MAERFFCTKPIQAGRIVLEGEEAHHLARVRRLGPGHEVEVFDGLSTSAYVAIVQDVGPRRVELIVHSERKGAHEPAVPLTLATAVPKGERFDWLVEKAVEVGVARLIPIQTSRSVVSPRLAKLERLERRVIEASKQCGRNRLMQIAQPAHWSELVTQERDATRLIADLEEGRPWTSEPSDPTSNILLAIGPEGGWTDAERSEARTHGWQPLRLARAVLRVETAAIVGAALILNQAKRS